MTASGAGGTEASHLACLSALTMVNVMQISGFDLGKCHPTFILMLLSQDMSEFCLSKDALTLGVAKDGKIPINDTVEASYFYS